MKHFKIQGIALLSGLLFAITASATSVPRLTFEEMTDRSELVVSGQITRTWSDWDSSHRFIWTHYELAVSAVHKGTAGSTVILSEPGGVAGGLRQTVAGTVLYGVGEKVFVFLERVPNGYLRTTGWAQGKYTLDPAGRVHAAAALAALELVPGKSASASPLSLDGITATELSARVTARVRSQQIRSAGAKQ